MTTIDLRRTLDDECLAIERFVALLRTERELLVQGEVDQMSDLLQDKGRLSNQLAQLAEQRSRLLAADGRMPDRQGMAAWFAAHPAETKACAAWTRLRSLTEEARDLNQMNGELIRLHLQHTAEALSILGAGAPPGLYGPDGQSTSSASGRIADRA
ncbi:MAG TPA: flagellar protein FlgN [Accumulibacter sp.]|uniref:flagella synthesis protein FlgN n=1 Tax=Accumulibacter sp. TaxID=2053492 RepID=UPI00287845DE|nr:flagellar protein FlgN [Accumulibacter sp.]MDS4056120.1 flagellar protein FlgN [Accumulibacter sp.]HMV03997.1 flagellar protein FlgN [Accumulibacter sp.]HMW62347.1 flagellar protein FlgN [Accumulibacter sp.]HMW78773.1 flagellar protein FlgN [Accumulibacter sp.]HMX67591.1 flagellar protein FlgN [Accumulibacter sp.]